MNAELTALASVSAPIAPLQSAAVMKRIMKVVSSRFAAGTDRGRSSGDTPNGVISWAQGFANKSKLSTTAKMQGFSGKSAGLAMGLKNSWTNRKSDSDMRFPTATLTLLRVTLTRLRILCLRQMQTRPLFRQRDAGVGVFGLERVLGSVYKARLRRQHLCRTRRCEIRFRRFVADRQHFLFFGEGH